MHRTKSRASRSLSWPAAATLLATLFAAMSAIPSMAQSTDPKPTQPLEQSALDSLKRMSERLASAQSIKVDVRDMRDIPSSPGNLLTFINDSEVEMERPDKLRVESETGFGDTLLIYNGSKLSLLDKEANAYATTDSSGGVDEILRSLAQEHGIQLAFEDFLLADPYAALSEGLISAYEVGPAVIDGDRTRHYAFAAENIEYQLWLDTTTDLPKLFAVTYLDAERPPRFLVEFDDWELDDTPDRDAFDFKAPSHAAEIEFLPAGQ